MGRRKHHSQSLRERRDEVTGSEEAGVLTPDTEVLSCRLCHTPFELEGPSKVSRLTIFVTRVFVWKKGEYFNFVGLESVALDNFGV